jgi:hypothetical protein
MKYALVSNKKVVNVIEWDGYSEYSPGGGISMVHVPDTAMVDIGWDYDGLAFWPIEEAKPEKLAEANVIA